MHRRVSCPQFPNQFLTTKASKASELTLNNNPHSLNLDPTELHKSMRIQTWFKENLATRRIKEEFKLVPLTKEGPQVPDLVE